MEKGERIFESQHTRKDGTVIPVEVSARLIDYQGRKVIISHVMVLSFRKKAERELRERYHHEEYLALCSRDLLRGDRDSLESALGRLLLAADVSRVYIFENFEDPGDGFCMRQTHEVVAEGVPPEMDNELLQHVSYQKDGFLRWQSMLSSGESISGNVETFPESEREVLEPQGIVSMLVIPILVEGEWFGFVGFDELRFPREWSPEEVRLLRVGAEMIGNYIERTLYEERIANLLAEKELILQEVHHRIKNNMNTMKNLLSLQADRSDDPAVCRALEAAEKRMTGMMVLYDRLYRGKSIQRVSLKDYLSSLVEEIVNTFDLDVSLDKEIDDIDIPERLASPLGILVNELITNAMKYAFHEGRENRLVVTATVSGSRVRLVIADNGEGFSGDSEGKGFGLDLVRALAGQLEGAFSIEQDGGTRCILDFSVPSHQ
jgi:two-component sensor histidine kinase